MNSLEWMDLRACRDAEPELFFHPTPNAVAEAKATCLDCGVRDECLTYALAADIRYGVWGGLDEDERRALRSPGVVHERRPNPPSADEQCGTYSGVGRHRRRHEALCDDCRGARTAYERQRKRRKVASA